MSIFLNEHSGSKPSVIARAVKHIDAGDLVLFVNPAPPRWWQAWRWPRYWWRRYKREVTVTPIKRIDFIKEK